MQIYLDTETTKFFADPEIAKLPRAEQIPALARHFGIGVTYDTFYGWRSWQAHETPALWQALIGQQIVGWNVIHFDVPLVQQAAALHGASDPGLDPWFSLDLFAEIRMRTGRWYKLEEIAQASLGRGKLGDGQKAAEWIRSGDPALIRRAAEYCREDVALVIELHGMAQTDGLILPPRAKDMDLATYRWWCSEDGSAWKLAGADGEELDSHHWPG